MCVCAYVFECLVTTETGKGHQVYLGLKLQVHIGAGNQTQVHIGAGNQTQIHIGTGNQTQVQSF